MRRYLASLLAAVITAAFGGTSYSKEFTEPVTIEDLVSRIQIRRVSLAPDGRQVGFLTVKGVPRENLYEIAISLISTDGKTNPVLLSQCHLRPENTFEEDSGDLRKTVGQLAWRHNSAELAYTVHSNSGMELRIRNMKNGTGKTVLKGFDEIEITSQTGQLELETILAAGTEAQRPSYPMDFALLVKDGYRFYGPLANPKTHGAFVIRHWKYDWGALAPVETLQPDTLSYLVSPEEWVEIKSNAGVTEKKTSDAYTFTRDEFPSPDGGLAVVVEDSTRNLGNPALTHRTSQIVLKDKNNKTAESRVLVPSETPKALKIILGWDPNGKVVYYVSLGPKSSSLAAVSVDGHVRLILKAEFGFSLPNPSSEISQDRRTVVLVRSTNVVPDELVKVDMKTGVSTALWSPNEHFRSKALPTVRFVPIECCGADFYGRLYLPTDYVKGKRYPLVFTNYISSPGFYASVGDEVPILAMVAHGIAVFAMDSSEANSMSTTGDFRLEINRVGRPLDAMEWVLHKLSAEGILDPERCGLTGLSYGAEIAMYAYWKSKIFRALSVATTSWEPTNYVLAGVSYAKFLDSRGFVLPADGAYAKWKELAAGLNARADLPPLLVQSPDGEEYFGNIETWLRLRRVGAQIEWYEYPDEGHVKRSPANKWWVYERNLDWFRFWLGHEEDPEPAKGDQYARWRAMRKNWEAANAK